MSCTASVLQVGAPDLVGTASQQQQRQQQRLDNPHAVAKNAGFLPVMQQLGSLNKQEVRDWLARLSGNDEAFQTEVAELPHTGSLASLAFEVTKEAVNGCYGEPVSDMQYAALVYRVAQAPEIEQMRAECAAKQAARDPDMALYWELHASRAAVAEALITAIRDACRDTGIQVGWHPLYQALRWARLEAPGARGGRSLGAAVGLSRLQSFIALGCSTPLYQPTLP